MWSRGRWGCSGISGCRRVKKIAQHAVSGLPGVALSRVRAAVLNQPGKVETLPYLIEICLAVRAGINPHRLVIPRFQRIDDHDCSIAVATGGRPGFGAGNKDYQG
jgi:hypothetical protein